MTLLRRILPAPVLSATLLALWLVLARSISPGQLLWGLLLAWIVPLMTANLRAKAQVKRPLTVLRFLALVTRDVLASNLEVAWSLLRWRQRRPNAAFVIIPLELRDPAGLAVLAMVTTIVPGTVWSEIALDRSRLMLHVWDVDEEEAFIRRFKARYEAPLREIFE